jgi:hypothetical protein
VTAAFVPYDVFLRDEAASDERHEWVNGVVYAMTRGTPEHGRLTNRIVAKMLSAFLDDGCEPFTTGGRGSRDSRTGGAR